MLNCGTVNVVDLLLRDPDDRRALVSGDGTFTRGGLQQRADRWRGALAAAGIGPGDRVLLPAGNDPDFITAHLAVLGLGAVAVPLNPQAPVAALAHESSAVRPRAAVRLPSTPAAFDPGCEWLEPEAMEDGAPRPVVPAADDDPAVLLFTSGTAGLPKPAVLTHGNLSSALASMRGAAGDLFDAQHVVLAVIPLYHVFGLSAVVHLGLAAGATIVVEEFHSTRRVAESVVEHGVTAMFGPPTMWQALAATPDVGPETFSGVNLALSGAAKLDPVVHAGVRETLGLALWEGYGLTESCAVAASTVGIDAPVGSVGPLMPGVEGRLVDPDGLDVLIGDTGEVWLRGPMVSPGYAVIGDDGTIGIDAVVDDDGWLHTGDLAVVDEEGRLSVVDRLKDLVIVSGFNVVPAEVEAALRLHPEVVEAAVTGEADAVTGEAVVAHVVVSDVDVDIDALVEHCRGLLARYKVPHRFEVVEALPRGLGGKLRRQDLA